jgi:hypothetical protein
MIGSMFQNGPVLIKPMLETIHSLAPGAQLKRLTVPPVAGGLILAMDTVKRHPDPDKKNELIKSITHLKNF